jgi:tRNA-2-methylthio-N6-dimethylallyladenosine synthase
MRARLLKSYKHVDLIFGPHELWRFPELLEKTLTASPKTKITETRDIDGERVEGLPILRKSGDKAWLSIMYGCNNFCSYCVVPYVRGRERSRDFDSIIGEAKDIIDKGFKEITLLGQNVNSYGRDLYSEAEFPRLLRTIAELPGEFTLHFRTSHPKDAGEELFRVIADCDKVAKFLHLPFQSGNNRVLNAMNRRYTREQYLDKITTLKKLAPNVELSSDVIVGFPGETDEEFEDTLSLAEQVRFNKLFTFIYSPRHGTPAEKMPDPFTRAQKQVRFDKLITLQKEIEQANR